ncbi:MAG: hypothetical protein GX030_10850 [Firmicutes bacterium]|nr:hypothetical protein [Bacillota bacterium]
MGTFAIALKTGLFVYAILFAVSYTLWQLATETMAYWLIPVMILPAFLLVPLGTKCVTARRPLDPAAVGWKLGLQWMFLFLILDAGALWLCDPELSWLGMLDLKVGIGYLGRILLVLLSGPMTGERYRRNLRKGLRMFRR